MTVTSICEIEFDRSIRLSMAGCQLCLLFPPLSQLDGHVMQLVALQGREPCVERRVGSNPTLRTNKLLSVCNVNW